VTNFASECRRSCSDATTPNPLPSATCGRSPSSPNTSDAAPHNSDLRRSNGSSCMSWATYIQTTAALRFLSPRHPAARALQIKATGLSEAEGKIDPEFLRNCQPGERPSGFQSSRSAQANGLFTVWNKTCLLQGEAPRFVTRKDKQWQLRPLAHIPVPRQVQRENAKSTRS
jgi:hypothetical protein